MTGVGRIEFDAFGGSINLGDFSTGRVVLFHHIGATVHAIEDVCVTETELWLSSPGQRWGSGGPHFHRRRIEIVQQERAPVGSHIKLRSVLVPRILFGGRRGYERSPSLLLVGFFVGDAQNPRSEIRVDDDGPSRPHLWRLIGVGFNLPVGAGAIFRRPTGPVIASGWAGAGSGKRHRAQKENGQPETEQVVT